jgi:epoxyqueuosine reductase
MRITLQQFDECVARCGSLVGIANAGVAAVPLSDDVEYAELALFADWVASGNAGEMKYLERRNDSGALKRSSLRDAVKWANSVVMCAFDYNSAGPLSIDEHERDAAWIARYAWPEARGSDERKNPPTDYHDYILERLRALEAELHRQLEPLCGEFTSRSYVDTGPFIERVYAKHAGLGWIAKNTCLIHPKTGSFFFLGGIVTSIEIAPHETPSLIADSCGSCTRCIDACPTAALTPYWMDATRCISYLTIEKRGEISEEFELLIGRNVFGCDICQEVCPWNKKASSRATAEKNPAPAFANMSLAQLAAMSREEFNRSFGKTPISRTKYSGFRRNIAIAMGNSGDEKFLSQLEAWSTEVDPVLAATASRAAERLRKSVQAPAQATTTAQTKTGQPCG